MAPGHDENLADPEDATRYPVAEWILADCDSKRRIVVATMTAAAKFRAYDQPVPEGQRPLIAGEAADTLLRLLALPYASHPDYREEWRP